MAAPAGYHLFITVRNRVGDKHGFALSLRRDDRSGTHARMGAKGCRDVVELDAVAADFHLGVGTADELDLAIGRPAGEVARAVEAVAGPAEGIGQEAACGLLGRPR